MHRRAQVGRKFEMIGGKLLWSDEDRETLLALLLESVGADRAVQLGDPEVWPQPWPSCRSVLESRLAGVVLRGGHI